MNKNVCYNTLVFGSCYLRNCIGCFFDELQSDIYENPCRRIKCNPNERKDRKRVKIIRVK